VHEHAGQKAWEWLWEKSGCCARSTPLSRVGAPEQNIHLNAAWFHFAFCFGRCPGHPDLVLRNADGGLRHKPAVDQHYKIGVHHEEDQGCSLRVNTDSVEIHTNSHALGKKICGLRNKKPGLRKKNWELIYAG